MTHKIQEQLVVTDRQPFNWRLRDGELALGTTTRLMGILNVTPDSFSDGGHYASHEAAVNHAREMVELGADIIDVGGESTRPGAQPIDEKDEMARVLPVIEALAGTIAVPLSIDTYKASVADAALKAGASIVNDISGFRFDARMPEVIARHSAGVVIMHSRGRPGELHGLSPVLDIFADVEASFRRSLVVAQTAGINPNCIVFDPGLGFGKTLDDNLFLLGGLPRLSRLGRPLLVGPSRKSFIGVVTQRPEPSTRLLGSAVSVALAAAGGAHIVRVHDVAAMRESLALVDAIRQATHATKDRLAGFEKSDSGESVA
ncbi:MAG: dihydropteroate synthase [Chloracidobacterium sp.]|uniref:Dihydropteroate synthase n=1 Tax=Chloracidobacterium validum TaxID=2821543 RepID=A0ABX8B733_9BACT|nr:dihydropteroate synthase [Chloracidobacterium validum]QUW02479.1 dihydropteroate synthase [Chloracidobacterium validum]